MGISPLILLHVIFIIACIITYSALRQLNVNLKVSLIFYIFLILNPIFYGAEFYRIYRDPFIGILILLIFSILLFLSTRLINSKLSNFGYVASIFLISVFIGFLNITKPDVIYWLTPLIIFGYIYLPLKLDKNTLFISMNLIILNLFFLFGSVITINEYIKYKNDEYYGVSVVEDFSRGPFSETYKILTSLPGNQELNYSPVDNDRRELAYEVSPSFKSLQSAIESPMPGETDWYKISCESSGICQDAGPWTSWLLRDAVANTITDNNPQLYLKYFTAINEELGAFCSMSKSCSRSALAVQLHPISVFDGVIFLNSFSKMINSVVNLDSSNPSRPFYFSVDAHQLDLWLNVIPDLEIYWEEKTNTYNKDSDFLVEFNYSLKFIYKFIIILLIISLGFFYRLQSNSIIKNAILAGIFTSLLHLLLLAYVDSHGGAIGLSRSTYLLESIPLLFMALGLFAALLIQSRLNLYKN